MVGQSPSRILADVVDDPFSAKSTNTQRCRRDADGVERGSVFTNLALGAAYTPLAIGPDGKIYTQNDGHLFVIGSR